jgi:membrane associated rhomboid family serine protease
VTETAARTGGSAGEASEWALVLAASGIAYRVEEGGAGWAVLVPDADLIRARRALRAYDVENRRPLAATPVPGGSVRAAWTVGLLVGALLLGFFAMTGPPAPGSIWFERGAAAAAPMLGAEPWRAVTALTLHVDTAHALGNAVATALFLPPILERLGPGSGLGLVVLAGVGANLLAAALQGPPHVAAGASTATFGAIGILAGLRLRAAASRAGGRDSAWWIVPVAALVLLAILGTGRGADVLGHAVGLATGGALGLAAAFIRRPLAGRIQWALVGGVALAVAGCWRLALGG